MLFKIIAITAIVLLLIFTIYTLVGFSKNLKSSEDKTAEEISDYIKKTVRKLIITYAVIAFLLVLFGVLKIVFKL